MTFGQKLKALRKKQNLTQAQLGEALGVAQRTVASWEQETRQPDLDTLVALAKFFQVSTDYLLGNSPPKNINPLPLAPGVKEKPKAGLTDEDFAVLAAHSEDDSGQAMDKEVKEELYVLIEEVLRKNKLIK